jgi:hypothetical protein
MTTLSIEIRKAIEEAGGQPLEVIDPETHERYMLVKAELFDRLSKLLQRGPLTVEEQRYLLEQAGRRAGWDDPEMDIYDDLAAKS